MSWAHQTREIEAHAFEPSWFLFWDPRTGKTRTIVDEIALWISQGCKRVLIVAPQSACGVWLKDDELGRFDLSKVNIVDISSDESIVDRTHSLRLDTDAVLPNIVVVNRDVIFKERSRGEGKGKLTGMQAALKRWGPQAIVFDEVHDYRSVSSKRSRAAYEIAKRAPVRRGLSGTPDPRDYIDYFGIYKIIAPDVFGTRKSDFLERYCNMNHWYPNKVDSYRNVEELQAKIFSRASRVRQQDCFDMPDVLPDIIQDVPFTKLARELYTELVKNTVADFLGLEIDATHQLARLTILHQLAAGYVRDEHGSAEWVFDGKINATLDYVDELIRADKRVVIFHHYTPEGERLELLLAKRYKGRVGSLNGKTPRGQRSPEPFLAAPKMRVFVAQEDTANVSISLKQADHILWYSWGPRSEIHYQARQRIFAERSEKPHGLSYTYLEVPNTVDGFYRQTIARKVSASQALLDSGFTKAAYGK